MANQKIGVNRDPFFRDFITIPNFSGKDIEVVVAFASKLGPRARMVVDGGFGYGLRGPFKGKPFVTINLNAMYPWAAIANPNYSEKKIRAAIMHELTHAADKLVPLKNLPSSKGMPDPGEVDMVEYANNPNEVRAHMREIYEEIRSLVHKIMATKHGDDWGVAGAVTRMLNNSDAWGRVEPYLTRQNRNRILKGLITAFEDDGL